MHSLTARSMTSFNSMESRYLLIFATKTAYSYKTWQLSMMDWFFPLFMLIIVAVHSYSPAPVSVSKASLITAEPFVLPPCPFHFHYKIQCNGGVEFSTDACCTAARNGESVSGTDPRNTKIHGAAYWGYKNSDVHKGSMFCQSEMKHHFCISCK